MELQSLNQIFSERIFRIPDYQRGYAWDTRQLEEFWEDIIRLDAEGDRFHYTGMLTVERVPEKSWHDWEDDKWLLQNDYKPYFVVDGQQRLTTSIILIQVIIEKIEKDSLVSRRKEKLIEKFIYEETANSMVRSFKFGYEKDNPSNEYLKQKIFGVHSHSFTGQETLYTRNLMKAKEFFARKVKDLNDQDIELIYKKITQKLKYNFYIIEKEADVFVVFETLNNRGRPLTNLELLKNRLIYISTLFEEKEATSTLRKNINESWKIIYANLGKNPDNPLGEDDFLKNHWIMYFTYSRNKRDDYIRFLLNKKFNSKFVYRPSSEEEKLEIAEVSEYVKNLQQSAEYWFVMHNPYFPDSKNTLTKEQKIWIDCLIRLGFRSFKPLILAALVTNQNASSLLKMLIAIERFNFAVFDLCQRRRNTGDSEFYRKSHSLFLGEDSIDVITDTIERWANNYFDPEKFLEQVKDLYHWGRKEGFYGWRAKYFFLYEYERYLKKKASHPDDDDKLKWGEFSRPSKDQVTIEHIFPQNPTDTYWTDRFSQFDEEQTKLLTHSLGNLLALSRSKNSILQNDCFPKKKNNGEGVGYFNGSFSENEVSEDFAQWTPKEIYERGIKLLDFMERRWNIRLDSAEKFNGEQFKKKLLSLPE